MKIPLFVVFLVLACGCQHITEPAQVTTDGVWIGKVGKSDMKLVIASEHALCTLSANGSVYSENAGKVIAGDPITIDFGQDKLSGFVSSDGRVFSGAYHGYQIVVPFLLERQ